jgi:hypothetical protein
VIRNCFLALALVLDAARVDPARRMVAKKGARWELTSHGWNLLGQLTC